ncbi:MAG: hypothetical protein JWR21_3686 [Herminiimonas sp.]|nr:hypothetical protein [Herminiimonas sp.]
MATFDVILPVKNCRSHLQQAIQSILNQRFRDWRLIVLDHMSDDGSYELACNISEMDARIEVRRYDARLSFSELLNAGLAIADAMYVLRQDADDVSLPGRMDSIKQAFEQHADIVCLGSGGQVIDAYNTVVGALDVPLGKGAVPSTALFRIPIVHPTAAFRLSALNRLGAQYGIDFLGVVPSDRRLAVPKLAEDYFLFGQLALVCRCENLRDQLIQYRWHEKNVSQQNEMAQLGIALAISRALAESFAGLHAVSPFDPAPFCNHGDRLVDLNGRTDFREEFTHLQHALARGSAPTLAFERELAFRRVLANRRLPGLPYRYCAFARRYGRRLSEWYTVKTWMLRKFKRKALLQSEMVCGSTAIEDGI